MLLFWLLIWILCAKINGMDWNLLGHDWAIDLLQAHISQNEVRHAYLFCGAPGIGRRTLALRFVQALNCPSPPQPGVACRSCLTCQQIEKMQYSDLLVVQAEQEGATLKVDQIRELQHSLALAPYQGGYKVALLLRFEEAHPSAMNALLKTLEEPAPQVVILLTADSPENLLPTIVSRCEVMRLRPLSLEQVSQGLQDRSGLPAEQARLLAHISGGRPGLAFRFIQQPERLEQRAVWLNDLERLLPAHLVARFNEAESLAKDKENLRPMLLVWLSFWRDVTLKSAGAGAPITNLDRLEAISALGERLDLHTAGQMAGSLERAVELLERNINSRLVMENLMLDMPCLPIAESNQH
jgi:DNA polymerase-3 subunit delta'